jgi:hypothetical protein
LQKKLGGFAEKILSRFAEKITPVCKKN